MGKGKFIIEMARKNPEINYIGIEMYSSVLVRAVQRLNEEHELSNLRFICVNAECLESIFSEREVARIYLNFSDPWPKERHSRRRLTSPAFLNRYRKVLTENGLVEFKTDNKELFNFSLLSIPEAGWEVVEKTFDLHKSEIARGNVMTEYEEKFSAQGVNICKLVACFGYNTKILNSIE
jgi:tRNA (guanine-N7-)-methyltransferase